jgi:antitoxin (DNA-binding transcriptional repressor) of toxin-antitoxin stability system
MCAKILPKSKEIVQPPRPHRFNRWAIKVSSVVVAARNPLAKGTRQGWSIQQIMVSTLGLRVINIIIDIMKPVKKPSGRGSISTHEMRFQFGRILQAVKAGRSLTLTYRNKPLASIVPLKPHAEISPHDPVFRLHELAEPIGPLTNEEMDAAIYGQ